MAGERRQAADAAIGERVHDWLTGHLRVGVLALWWPLPGEPDPRGWFERLVASGWTISLPRVVEPDRPLSFGRWQPGIEMREERFRVHVPWPFEVVHPTVIAAPCVGFDRRGWRLGYGGGYYDRTLQERGIPCIGVAYDECETTLEPQVHDRPLTVIVTQTRTITPSQGATER